MTTSSKRQIPQSVLCPGDTLIRCNGQDISKKGGKSRGRIMVVMPNHFVLPTKVIGDQQLGNLQKLNTDAPELLIDTEEGVLTFVGKFVLFSTKFMSIQCHPKKAQNICTDIYDRALVFSEPVFTPKPAAHASSTTLRTQISHLTVEESGRNAEEHKDETPLSSAPPKSISPYSIHFGMSSLADPLSKSSLSVMNSIQRTGSTGTVALSQSSVPRSPTKSNRGRSSAVYRSESSDGSDGDDDDVFHHGHSDEEAGPVRSSARRVSSAAKSMKEISSSSGEGSGADSGAEDDSFSDTQKRAIKKQAAKPSAKTATDASKPRATAVTSGSKRKSGDSKVLCIDLESSEGEMAQASPKKKPRSTPASKPTAGAFSAKKSTANSAQKKKKSTFSGRSDESGGDDSDASEMQLDRSSGDEAGVRSVPVRSASRRSSAAAIASFKDPSSGSSEEAESSDDDVALTSLVGKGRKPAAATTAAKIATTASVKTTSTVGKTAKSAATTAPSAKRPAAKTNRASTGESDGSSAVDDSESDSNSSFGGSSSKKKSSSSAKAAPKKSAKAAAPATKIESVVKKVPVARNGSTSSSSRKKKATVVDMVSDSESSSHVNDHDDSDFEALLSSKLTYTATASPVSTTPRRLVRKFGSQNSGSKVDAICIDD